MVNNVLNNYETCICFLVHPKILNTCHAIWSSKHQNKTKQNKIIFLEIMTWLHKIIKSYFILNNLYQTQAH